MWKCVSAYIKDYLSGREKLCTAHAHISHNFKKPASADVFAFEFSGKYHAQ